MRDQYLSRLRRRAKQYPSRPMHWHCDDAAAELWALQRLLIDTGPTWDRVEALEKQTVALQVNIARECTDRATQLRLLIGYEEVLRDLGQPTTQCEQVFEARCGRILRYWDEQGCLEKYVENLITTANGYRLWRDFNMALQLLDHAIHRAEPAVATPRLRQLVLLAAQHRLRIRGVELKRPCEVQADMKVLTRLTQLLDDGKFWVPTWCEQAGMYAVTKRFAAAEQCLHRIMDTPWVPASDTRWLPVLRVQTAIGFDIGDRQMVRDGMRRFEVLCGAYPSYHHQAVLHGFYKRLNPEHVPAPISGRIIPLVR